MTRPYNGVTGGVAGGLLIIIPAAVLALAPLSPAWVERWYSTFMYPPLQRSFTTVTNLVPFAVLDLLLIVSVGAAAAAIVGAARRARCARSVKPLGGLLWRATTASAGLYLAFLAMWGLNYRRVPMGERLVLTAAGAQTAQVLPLGLEAVDSLNRLYADAHRAGWPGREWHDPPLVAAAAAVQQDLLSTRPAVPGRLKRSLLGVYFRWAGVDGMVNPFGLDVMANPDLLPFERPFVAAHEWAHLAGFADESEASFVGFLTCVRGSVPDQYSAWFFLYWQIAGETDRATRTRLWDALADGPRADVTAVITRLREGQLPRLRTASWMVYDQYLKANRVEAGVESYGQVINLLVRARFQPGWVPVRR